MEKTIIESLWKQGHTKMAIDYAKEHNFTEEEIVKIVHRKDLIMSKGLSEELAQIKKLNSLSDAKEFADEHFKNVVIIHYDDSYALLPDTYYDELVEHDIVTYKKEHLTWM